MDLVFILLDLFHDDAQPLFCLNCAYCWFYLTIFIRFVAQLNAFLIFLWDFISFSLDFFLWIFIDRYRFIEIIVAENGKSVRELWNSRLIDRSRFFGTMKLINLVWIRKCWKEGKWSNNEICIDFWSFSLLLLQFNC